MLPLQEELREVSVANKEKRKDPTLVGFERQLRGVQEEDDSSTTNTRSAARKTVNKPRKVLLGSDEILKDYRFDDKRLLVEVEVKVGMADKKLLMISLVEALVAKFVVKQVAGIKRAFVIVRTSWSRNADTCSGDN